MVAPSTNNPMATTAQAFDDDGLASFIDVNRARDTACERPGDCTTGCVATFGFTKRSADTGTQNCRAQRFMFELIAGKGLTRSQISLVGWGWCSIKDRPVVRTCIGTSRHQDQTYYG
jgi:hypothetical protein